MLVEEERPTDYMIDKAWDRNDDGGGVAWREVDEATGKPVVLWQKGIERVGDMKDLAKSLPLPYVLHFRVASCGGVRPSLTHPFPIDKETSLDLEGKTTGYVLFHNGDWRSWDEQALKAAIISNTPIPGGRWSDSRAMAWLCSIYGRGFMEFLPTQKGIAFGPGPEDLEVFNGTGWFKINDVWCSNDYFMTRGVNQFQRYCRYGTCTENTNIGADGYCAAHKGGQAKPAVPASFPCAEPAGGAQPQIPFPLLAKGTIIQLEVAERLHKQKDLHTGRKLISNGTMRKIRKIYSKLASNQPVRVSKAKLDLVAMSNYLSGIGPAL